MHTFWTYYFVISFAPCTLALFHPSQFLVQHVNIVEEMVDATSFTEELTRDAHTVRWQPELCCCYFVMSVVQLMSHIFCYAEDCGSE